jgi:signal transduction histidine kinase
VLVDDQTGNGCGAVKNLLGVLATDTARAEALNVLSSAEATVALGRLLGYVVVAVRGGVAAVGAVAALISMSPPATPVWVVPAVAINCLWAAAFVAVVLRVGLRPWALVVDVLLSLAFALGQVHLVGPGALPDGGGWVATLCSITLIITHLAWRAPAAVVAGVVIAVGYVVGAGLAGTPDGGVPQLVAFGVQIVSTSVLMLLLRRVSRFADGAIARYQDARREARISEAVRAAEREQSRVLHDKVLGVLMPVGKGDIGQTSTTLRAGAAVALEVIANLDSAEVAGGTVVRLDQLLERTATRTSVRVDHDLTPVLVPGDVAVAFAGAAEAALDNVVRHARTPRARLELTGSTGRVRVEVADDGCGFDTTSSVPAHRYGLREAIRGRMSAVGGGADVESAPGTGTRVRMWWRSDG